MRTMQALGWVLLLTFAAGCGETPAPYAEITRVEKNVTVNSKPAAPGPVKRGDLIEVAADGMCQLAFSDGTKATLRGHGGEGVSLKLPAEQPGAVAQALALARGALGLSVAPGNKARWQVETENCTASIEGTVFVVAVLSKEKITRVLVSDGAVKVANAQGSVVVNKHGAIAVGAGQAPKDPDKYNPNDPLGAMVEEQLTIKPARDVDRQ